MAYSPLAEQHKKFAAQVSQNMRNKMSRLAPRPSPATQPTPPSNSAGPNVDAFVARQKGLLNEQYDAAHSRLKGAQDQASASAMENSDRLAAIRGTSGAGFENKLKSLASQDVNRTFGDLSTGLDVEKAKSLQAAEQFGSQLGEQARQFDSSLNENQRQFGATFGEQQRQFDATVGLQRWIASNEMDLNKLATFVNTTTAFKQAGLNSPEAWDKLFSSGLMQKLFPGMSLPSAGTSQANVASADQARNDRVAAGMTSVYL